MKLKESLGQSTELVVFMISFEMYACPNLSGKKLSTLYHGNLTMNSKQALYEFKASIVRRLCIRLDDAGMNQC